MSLRHFKTLIRCLRFDDRNSREQRKKHDKLCLIHEIFELFVKNCQKNYSAGENVTIDEMLPGFRGRCPFRQYVPLKPSKYGIKVFTLEDSKMSYTYNLEVYAGTQPEGPFRVSNKPPDVVKRMVQPLLGSGRNIMADKWFTDFALVDGLKWHKLNYVGTVRKNNRELPLSFVNVRGRKQYDSMFGFNDDVCRNNKHWPMVIFYLMLNVAGINSLLVYLGNSLELLCRRVFLKKLAHELTLPELQRRSHKLPNPPEEVQPHEKFCN